MQVKATATGPVPAVLVPCQPGDFEVTGPAVVHFAPVVTLSRDDLVAALLLAEVDPAELAAMTVEQVRHEVAFALAAYGLNAVHQTIYQEANARFVDDVAAAYTALCWQRIAEAFATPAPATRPRAAARSIGTRRTLVKVAA